MRWLLVLAAVVVVAGGVMAAPSMPRATQSLKLIRLGGHLTKRESDVHDEREERRTRRKFTDEFRAGAVKLVLDEGRSVAEVSRDLDVHASLLSRWVAQARVDAGKGSSGALTTAEKEELARLRKEVRTLKMERDILKKAAAFFAKENA
jgi:transposase